MFLLCRCGGLRGGIAALHDFHPHSRVRHWDRLWSSLVKGEGDSVGCVVLLTARPLTSGLRIKSAMTECHALLHPVDSRLRGNDGPRDYGDFRDYDDVLHRFHPQPSPLP